MSTTYGTLIRNGVNYSHDTAESISYDNTNSGLTSTNAQDAINELDPLMTPTGGTNDKYLRGNNAWQTPTNTTYKTFDGNLSGLVLKCPGDTSKFYKADGTWDTPADHTYGIVNSSVDGLVPVGGDSGTYLRADGTWNSPPNTTYSLVSTDTSGLVRVLTGETDKYLKGNGWWDTPADHTYGTVTTELNGLVPSGGTNAKYLRADGSWQTPTNHTYAVMTSGKTGLAPNGGTTATFLRGDAKWITPADTTYAVMTSGTSGLAPSGGTSAKYLRGDATWQTPSIPDTSAYMVNTTASATYRLLYTTGTSTATANAGTLKGFLYYNPSNALLRMRSISTASEIRISPTYIYFRHNGTNAVGSIVHDKGQKLTFKASNENFGVILGTNTYSGTTAWVFAPLYEDTMRLGSPSYLWTTVYAVNGSINTSDRNHKTDINDLSESVKDFIMDLKPVSYMFKDGDRTHYGLISQDVEETMTKLGMTAMDFGGFCKDLKSETYYADDDVEHKTPLFRNIEGEYQYSLRYDEFIAPMVKTVQMQRSEIDEQIADIAELKSRLDRLENK